MIPLYSREAVRAVDADAIERLGVPGLVLMENAGRGATNVLLKRFAGRLRAPLILGGTGQNGGDAWVVARHLLVRGIRPRCVLLGALEKVRGDAAVNLAALTKLGVTIETAEPDFSQASVVVDGLFGTGLDRDITGAHAELIARLNAAGRPVFALDLPSGIDANTGAVLGVAVRAEATATFAAHKRGLHQFPGVEHAGHVSLVSIGVPVDAGDAALLEPSDIAKLLPRRPLDAHKGTSGHVLALAGSPGKTGAALLAALGALRGGAGLVTIATQPEARASLDQKVLEVMTADLAGYEGALTLAKKMDAALLGPGFGLDAAHRDLIKRLAVELPVPTVLDADGLTALADDLESLKSARAPRVLTPHPGEAARLLGCDARAINRDRYGSALKLAQRAGHVVVLKGARSIIASPTGAMRVCREGTPALGVAGTGDVLSGVIAAQLVASAAMEAACAGVFLHACAGEIMAASDRGMLASEVAEGLPRALERCRGAMADMRR